MPKKPDKLNTEKGKDTSEYYKLNKDAVDRLVNANASNAPEVSEEEIRKYTGKKKFRIPPLVKILFTKFWFKGAACFFIFWGLGTYLNSIDLIFVFAFALGVITDLLENNFLRFFERDTDNLNNYIMFPKKGLPSLFFNIAYAFVVFTVVRQIYNIINITAMSITGKTDELFLGVEPILFGLFYLLVDGLFLLIRNTFKKIVKDALDKQKKESK
ncbi:MAG: hypothetical protein K6F63_03150 [Lachnospiraceae bacterium]|nr:hypothetical protein [Lachnospiraceae bacterium]